MKLIDVDETGGGCSKILGPCNTDFLFIHNHLSEFLTEEDKKKARRNLGIKDAPAEWEEEINRLDDRITNTDNTLTTKIQETESELSGEIEDTKTTLTEKIGTVETNLSGEIETVKTELSEEISTAKTNLSEKITTVEADLTTKVNAVETDLTEKIETTSSTLTQKIEDTSSTLTAKIDSTKSDIEKIIIDDEYTTSAALNEQKELITNLTNKEAEDVDNITKDIVDLGAFSANLSSEVNILKNLKIKEKTATDPDVYKTYGLYSGSTQYGDLINIPKDKSLKDVKLGYANATVNATTGEINIGTATSTEPDPQHLIYSMALADGTYSMINIDLTKFFSDKEIEKRLSTIQDSDENLITVDSITARGLVSEDFVDLGLPSGTLWMKCNIGAETETDYGLFFQWGDTVGYDESTAAAHSKWSTCPGNGGASSYNTSALSTWNTANLTNGVLNNDVDAAYVHTNGKAKMPTLAQYQELISGTNSKWTTIDGITGRKFTNKKDSSKYIFIPAAGCFYKSTHHDKGSVGNMWSSLFDASNVGYAYIFGINNSQNFTTFLQRYEAITVRGIYNSDYKIVLNTPSKSGTIALQADVDTINDQVDTINTQITSIDSQLADINEILLAQYTKVSLSASPRIIEKGTTNSISLSWNCTFNDKDVSSKTTSMQLKSGSTVIASTGTSYTDSISDSKSYYVTAVYNGVTKTSSTVTVNAYYPVYVGKGGKDFDETTILANATKYVQANKTAFKPSITYATGEYGWFCYPNGYGDPVSIKANGFDVAMQAVQEVTINGISYRAFRTYTDPNQGTINYEITF